MNSRRVISILVIIAIIATGVVTALFIVSENIIHYRNNFVRRFSDQVEKNFEIDLGLKGYYFAGESADSLYLGNYDGPLHFAVVDKKLAALRTGKLEIDRMDLPFRSVEVRVRDNFIFLLDGTVPCIFRGNLEPADASYASKPNVVFSRVVAVDSTTIAYRTHDMNGESVIGLSKLDGTSIINPNLLEKQIDGNFDVDGSLYYDNTLKKLVYVYLYRNQYIIAAPDLSLVSRGNTIDTVSKAQIKVTYVKSHGERKMSAPPVTVNKTAAAHNGLLFINSGLIGKYEDRKVWNQASVVDIYKIEDQSYIASLYIYDVESKKLRALHVSGNNIYAIIGHKLVSYKLTDLITKHYAVK